MVVVADVYDGWYIRNSKIIIRWIKKVGVVTN